MKKGLNTLRWKMISFNLEPEQRIQPVLIKRITVTGVAFTSACASCPPGTFSAKGKRKLRRKRTTTFWNSL